MGLTPGGSEMSTLLLRLLTLPPDMDIRLAVLVVREMLSGLVGGTLKTAMIFRWWRFRVGFAASAVPMTFLSAQSEPVGIETKERSGQVMSKKMNHHQMTLTNSCETHLPCWFLCTVLLARPLSFVQLRPPEQAFAFFEARIFEYHVLRLPVSI